EKQRGPRGALRESRVRPHRLPLIAIAQVWVTVRLAGAPGFGGSGATGCMTAPRAPTAWLSRATAGVASGGGSSDLRAERLISPTAKPMTSNTIPRIRK